MNILDIIDGNPNRLRESYFKNNYIELYNEIIEYTKSLDIPFKQRIWHFINGKSDYILCQKCGNRVSFNRNWLDGYKKYCSSKCAQSDESTKEKRRATVMNKYGVDNVAKSDIIKERQELTNIQRYGCKSSFQNIDVRKRWQAVIRSKYNVEHVFQLKSVKDKSMKTTNDRWGENHFVQTKFYKTKLLNMGFSDNLRKLYIKKHIEKYLEHGLVFIELNKRVLTLRSEKCGHEFSIHYDSLMRRIENDYEYCTVCNPVNTGQSQEEKLLIQWLESLSIDFIIKDRSLGLELDILIPSKNIAIEFNGLYWHSELYKDRTYHLVKTQMCQENGIRLIHIWEDNWLYKKDIVKSIIKNAIGVIGDKIYSRKCKIVTVSNSIKNIFLDRNHIQGKCTSSINIGLEYNGELVSIMTFGRRKINGIEQFELLRFCNKLDCVVIGSASKLFKYFRQNFKYDVIISYADVAQFTGEVYKILGFRYSHRSKPNYWWVIDGIRHHRFTWNKKRLVKEGANINMTEIQIMYERGYYRIFGCGQDKYIYN